MHHSKIFIIISLLQFRGPRPYADLAWSMTRPPPQHLHILIRSNPEFRSLRALARHKRADLLNHQVNPHVVVPTLGNDHIRVTLRRLDELQVHRPHRFHILFDDHFRGATAIAYIAHQPPDKTQVPVSIHEDFDVQYVAQGSILKY